MSLHHHSHDAHGHGHSHHESLEHAGRSTQQNIKIAFFLNLSFAFVELVGGYLCSSVAVMSDAVHDFGDSLVLGFALWSEKLRHKNFDRTKFILSYGYHRMSLISAAFTSLFLLVGSVFILRESVARFFSETRPNAWGMMALSLLGIAVNGFAALRVSRGHTENERMISWHLLEDVLGWVAVFLGSLVLMFTDWYWIDPLLSIAFTLFILRGVYINSKRVFHLFLQGVPSGVSLNVVSEKLLGLLGVLRVHDLHIWSLDGASHILTVHLVVSSEYSQGEVQDLKGRVRSLLKSMGKFHSTIEVESEACFCDDVCT